MSKRSHSPDPDPDQHPSSEGQYVNGHTQGRSWRWKKPRPSNLEQALVGADRLAYYGVFEDSFVSRLHDDDDDAELTVLFPLRVFGSKVGFSIQRQKLPSPFKARSQPMRVHTFLFPNQPKWTTESRAAAIASLTQQIKGQLDPNVGGEPRFFFPRANRMDVTFSEVKRYAKGHKLHLEWDGQKVLHTKVGAFLPDNQIVLGIRRVSSKVNLVELVEGVKDKLSLLLDLKSVQVLPSGHRTTKKDVVILAIFRDTSYHSGMLPGHVMLRDFKVKPYVKSYALHFEDRDDVCEVCRSHNHEKLEWFGRNVPEARCSKCHKPAHCTYPCGRPVVDTCFTRAIGPKLYSGPNSF